MLVLSSVGTTPCDLFKYWRFNFVILFHVYSGISNMDQAESTDLAALAWIGSSRPSGLLEGARGSLFQWNAK